MLPRTEWSSSIECCFGRRMANFLSDCGETNIEVVKLLCLPILNYRLGIWIWAYNILFFIVKAYGQSIGFVDVNWFYLVLICEGVTAFKDGVGADPTVDAECVGVAIGWCRSVVGWKSLEFCRLAILFLLDESSPYSMKLVGIYALMLYLVFCRSEVGNLVFCVEYPP